MHEPRFVEPQDDVESTRRGASLTAEVLAGLSAPQASLSPKFFYDALGSRLFDAITELDEYYLTRTEAAILQAHRTEISQRVHARLGMAPLMIDIGAGNCAKAASLFGSLQPSRYVAVDISVEFLRSALLALQQQHPAIQMTGVGLDFSSELALPPGLVSGPALIFYPGSSIGNFGPFEALRLLRQMHACSAGGALLIGVDLDKSSAVLQAAYDDALGVTAAFNLNALRHVNRLAGTDFALHDWRHVAHHHRAAGRMEMHLQAQRGLSVRWLGGERPFAEGERIHTENSYKWDREAFAALLRDAGFRHVHTWVDPQAWFGVMLAEAG